MRYEIMRIFTLPGNNPLCRSEERSDVGTRFPCCKGTDCHALRARNDRGFRQTERPFHSERALELI